MTVKEKRNLISEYCTTVSCEECLLKNRKWIKPFSLDLFDVCLDINESPESDLDKALALVNGTSAESDAVNRPSHYSDGKIEVIDFIEDKKLGFCLGNAIKYIARAGKKDPTKEVEDLKKARWYIERRIKELEAVEND